MFFFTNIDKCCSFVGTQIFFVGGGNVTPLGYRNVVSLNCLSLFMLLIHVHPFLIVMRYVVLMMVGSQLKMILGWVDWFPF